MRKKIIFIDGETVPANQKLLDKLFPYRLRGKGVFETMRADHGKIFALGAHIKRLQNGLSFLGLTLPMSERALEEKIHFLLKENHLPIARVRLVVWKEKGKSRISISILPYHPPARGEYTKGFKAVISNIRINERSPLSGKKSISHSFLYKAFRRAQRRRYDEVLFLNRRGALCEGSRSNIFYIKNGVLFTPTLSSGCLPGVTRAFILRLARSLKVRCREVSVFPKEFREADEAFLTNSLIEVMPLASIAGCPIGSGRAGETTKKLLSLYRKNLPKG